MRMNRGSKNILWGLETVLLKINLKLALSFSVTFNRDTTFMIEQTETFWTALPRNHSTKAVGD